MRATAPPRVQEIPVGDQGDEAFCAYVGDLPEEIEAQIRLLKGMTLRKKIGNKAVTPELILKAIAALNAECNETLGSMANVVKLYSANPKESKFSDRQPYCEDARLDQTREGGHGNRRVSADLPNFDGRL